MTLLLAWNKGISRIAMYPLVKDPVYNEELGKVIIEIPEGKIFRITMPMSVFLHQHTHTGIFIVILYY